MNILSLETSCDEIAAAIVDEHFCVQKNIIFSSVDLAKKTGGVVPEVAAREAQEKIIAVIAEVTQEVSWEDINAIAVTTGPGLIGSLLIGVEAAKTLSVLHHKPLIPVHHIVGHVCANLLSQKGEKSQHLPVFPCIVLTVSGGHNDILLWKSPTEVEILGTTIDDAAGECFDKCARMLDLPYPGGPSLSRMAEKGCLTDILFPRPMLQSADYNFSFSGLKTSLFYYMRDVKPPKKDCPNIAYAVQESIVDTLVTKCFSAVDEIGAQEVHLSGGVSANVRLRERFQAEAKKRCIPFRFPKNILFCTDNAAMIGAAGHLLFSSFPSKKWHSVDVQVDVKREVCFFGTKK